MESLCGLSYRESDLDKFLFYTEKAYKDLPSKYTLKNYITALCMVNDIKTAVQVLIEDEKIKPLYKAELILSVNKGQWDLLRLKVLYSIREFAMLRKELQEFKAEDNSVQAELAHYNYEIGCYDLAMQIYSRLITSSDCDSPLIYQNLAIY